MQRWLTAMLCSLAIALLGADAPLPAGAPSLVVFTLVPSGTVTIESTARIAAAISVRIETEGGIAIKSAPPDVKQSDYLATARSLGVDYYVSGFVGPLGGGYSAALQLVGTASGIPVWSGTTTLSGTDDVADIADAVRTVIRDRVASTFAAIPVRTPAPAATPVPAAPAPAQVARAAVPAQSQAAAAPAGPTINASAPSIAILDAIGKNTGTSEEKLAYASDALAVALEKRGIVATRWHTQAPQIAVGGAALCEDTKTAELVEPSIKTESSSGMDDYGGNWNSVTVQLISFDCATHQVSEVASSDNGAYNWEWAADRSIAEVGARLPAPTVSTTK